MAPQEQSEIVKCLEDSRADFRAAAEGVSEAQAKVRPEPGRWSVLECVEHIVVAEGRFLGWLQNPPVAEPAPPMDKEKEAKLLLGVSGRSQRVNAQQPNRCLSDRIAGIDFMPGPCEVSQAIEGLVRAIIIESAISLESRNR